MTIDVTSTLISAAVAMAVATVVALGIDFAMKPRLEARTERLLVQQQRSRDALRSLLLAKSMLGAVGIRLSSGIQCSKDEISEVVSLLSRLWIADQNIGSLPIWAQGLITRGSVLSERLVFVSIGRGRKSIESSREDVAAILAPRLLSCDRLCAAPAVADPAPGKHPIPCRQGWVARRLERSSRVS